MQDGHTSVGSPFTEEAERLELCIRYIQDKWVIVACFESDREQELGAVVISINSIPILDFMQRLMQIIPAENEFFRRYRAQDFLRRKGILLLLGLADESNLRVSIIQKDGVEKEIEVGCGKRTPITTLGYTGVTVKRSGAEALFYYSIVEDPGVCYLQFNQCNDRQNLRFLARHFPTLCERYDKETSNMLNWAEFLQGMFGEIHQRGIEHLVVDLRNNSGGNSMLGEQFMCFCGFPDTMLSGRRDYRLSELSVDTEPGILDRIGANEGRNPEEYVLPYTYYRGNPGEPIYIESSQIREQYSDPDSEFYLPVQQELYKGKLYIMTTGMTYSSAELLAISFRDNKLATIYGTPTGGKPSSFGNVRTIKLPHTQLTCYISVCYFRRPDPALENLDSLYPDVTVSDTIDSLIAGMDNAWEQLLMDIRTDKLSKHS